MSPRFSNSFKRSSCATLPLGSRSHGEFSSLFCPSESLKKWISSTQRRMKRNENPCFPLFPRRTCLPALGAPTSHGQRNTQCRCRNSLVRPCSRFCCVISTHCFVYSTNYVVGSANVIAMCVPLNPEDDTFALAHARVNKMIVFLYVNLPDVRLFSSHR